MKPNPKTKSILFTSISVNSMSGEAVYVDDIPSPKDCVHGAFIYSTKPPARIKKIDFRDSLASEKILSFISAKDIPKDGENIGSASQFGPEALFGDPVAECAGQPLGIVVLLQLLVLCVIFRSVTFNYPGSLICHYRFG
jgi:xanthine dehydrogenase molybdopterin-binding subunit B